MAHCMALNKIRKMYAEDQYLALALASEEQVLALINKGVASEDDLAYWNDIQEELRYEMAMEFGG